MLVQEWDHWDCKHLQNHPWSQWIKINNLIWKNEPFQDIKLFLFKHFSNPNFQTSLAFDFSWNELIFLQAQKEHKETKKAKVLTSFTEISISGCNFFNQFKKPKPKHSSESMNLIFGRFEFMFSEKATQIWQNLPVLPWHYKYSTIIKAQYGLLIKHELYKDRQVLIFLHWNSKFWFTVPW